MSLTYYGITYRSLEEQVRYDAEEVQLLKQQKSNATNLENGTADVLIQTTDTNHSFKIMADGRAKVQSAPTESDDVVRKQELDTKFDKTNIVQTTGDSTTEVMSQKAVTDELNKTNNSLADLKEALYGYVLDTAEVETDSVIPSTVEVGGTTYNLVDNVRGLVKEIKGGTVNSDGLKSVEYKGLEVKGKNLLVYPFRETTVTKSGVTFTDNGDGSLTIDGKLNEGVINTYFTFFVGKAFKVDGAYTMSYKLLSGNTTSKQSNAYIQMYYTSNSGTSLFTETLWLKDSDNEIAVNMSGELNRCVMYIKPGAIFNNYRIRPMINAGSTATDYKPYREPLNILPFTTTLRGVNMYKDRIIITKNKSDDYYTATKETNCEAVEYTSGDENNAEYITDLTTTVKPLETPTTEVLSTTLTESDVMPLLELGGSVEIINENSLYVTGSTALEMVYKLINNTTTTSEVTK